MFSKYRVGGLFGARVDCYCTQTGKCRRSDLFRGGWVTGNWPRPAGYSRPKPLPYGNSHLLSTHRYQLTDASYIAAHPFSAALLEGCTPAFGNLFEAINLTRR